MSEKKITLAMLCQIDPNSKISLSNVAYNLSQGLRKSAKQYFLLFLSKRQEGTFKKKFPKLKMKRKRREKQFRPFCRHKLISNLMYGDCSFKK